MDEAYTKVIELLAEELCGKHVRLSNGVAILDANGEYYIDSISDYSPNEESVYVGVLSNVDPQFFDEFALVDEI